MFWVPELLFFVHVRKNMNCAVYLNSCDLSMDLANQKRAFVSIHSLKVPMLLGVQGSSFLMNCWFCSWFQCLIQVKIAGCVSSDIISQLECTQGALVLARIQSTHASMQNTHTFIQNTHTVLGSEIQRKKSPDWSNLLNVFVVSVLKVLYVILQSK